MRDEEIEAELEALRRESRARRDELRALAAALPPAMSRRALVTSMFRSVADAPDKPLVAKRVVMKVVRTPSDVVRRRRGR